MSPTSLSPKQVAEALGVSESSLKRWCDKGLLTPYRTAGGHRRIDISQVVQLAREAGHRLSEPELLGLPKGVGARGSALEEARNLLYSALTAGHDAAARELMFDALLAPHSIVAIGDDLVAPVFHRIGEGWERGTLDVYQERRAVEICLRTLHEFRRYLPQPSADAPRAMGGGLASDNANLPSALVELMFREQGWQAHGLGANLPVASLLKAIDDMRPRLVWVSVSHCEQSAAVCGAVNELYAAAKSQGTALLVGGRALTPELREQMQYTAYCDQLRHGASFAASIFPAKFAQPAAATANSD